MAQLIAHGLRQFINEDKDCPTLPELTMLKTKPQVFRVRLAFGGSASCSVVFFIQVVISQAWFAYYRE